MISVLIVDDHALFRAGLRSRLELEQDITSVGEAATAEAVSKARSLQPDLVLLDLLLPGTSGQDAIPKLAKVSPRSRVLVVSSQAAPSSVRQALSAGAAGYVPKRASDQELVAAIRQVAAGEGTSTLIWAPSWWCRIGQPRWSRCPSGSGTSSSCSRSGTPIRRSVGSATSRCEPWTPIVPTSCGSSASRHAPSWCCSPRERPARAELKR